MYVVAADGNPFDDSNFGTINSYGISNETPSWEPFVLSGMLLCLLVLLL